MLADQIASFNAIPDVVAQLQKMKLRSKISEAEADQLQTLMAIHFHHFKIAWGSEEVLPKHHYAMHIPTQLKRLGLLVDCFFCERKKIGIIQNQVPGSAQFLSPFNIGFSIVYTEFFLAFQNICRMQQILEWRLS